MKLGLVFQAALRESRGARGRLVFFTACLSIGVAAIVGVAALTEAIEDGLRAQSRELLAADVAVDGRRALPPELDGFFANEPGVERTDVNELATMASSTKNGASRLVEVKAIRGRFPFYGTIGLEPAGDFATLLTNETAIVAPDVLEVFGAKVGDDIAIGKARFRIAAVVTAEPGRFDFALTIGPRVFLTLAGLERAQIADFGARIKHKALFRLPSDPSTTALSALKSRIERELPGAEYLNVETHSDAQPTVRRAIQRVERYLGLGALLSLVLGGTGVAMIVRAWLASRTGGIAVMRVLGYRPREILALYAGNVALFALAGSFVGGVAGSLVPLFLPHFMPGLLPAGFELGWEPAPIVRGLVLGVAIAIVFSIPPLTGIWRVPPSRVLRNEAEPLPPNRAVQVSAFTLLALGLTAAAWYQSHSLLYASMFTGGVGALAGLLALAALALRKLAALLPRARLNPYVLHGVAALSRPNAGITGAVVALGLGVLVVAAMGLVENRLVERLRKALPHDAPSVFLLDVQPDQWAGVRETLTREGATSISNVPVVTARLAQVDGVGVAELAAARKKEENPDRRTWMLTREQRITWMKELPSDNRIVDGTLWSDPSPREVSVEEEYAHDLGAHVGSKLVFDVQGVELEFLVTSLRRVEWESFGINFFLVAEPGALDDAPHFELGAARLEADAESRAQDALAREFPNVTLIRIRAVLEKVLKIMARLAIGVRILGSFTIATGIVILAGVVSASTLHRAREVALLKTLGVTRAGVAALFATEFALIGIVAGLIGSIAALVLAWIFLERAVELEAALPWWIALVAGLATGLLAALCGLLACARALTTRPIESLRG